MPLGDIALAVGRSTGPRQQITDAITFIEAPWGLNMPLFPVQRVILKAHYGLALDDNLYGLDLNLPVPTNVPDYADITEMNPDSRDFGFYKFRIPITDWRGQNRRFLSEADYLRFLNDEGRCNIREVIPGRERRQMVLSIGRRSGKTTIAAAVAAYETYKLITKGNPQMYYGVTATNPIQIISVATDKDQAGLLYQEASGHFTNCPFFAQYTANNTQTYARFQTPSDIQRYGLYSDDPRARASIKVTFRSCVAKGLRGAGNIVIILDEIAHFTDEGQSSAEKVYDAVTPSAASFSPKNPLDRRQSIGESDGRVICISSPLGKQGMFYKLFDIGMKGGKAAEPMLCIQAPTWEVNPTIEPSFLEQQYLKDPTVFFTEFGGEFTDRTSGWIETRKDLENCIDPVARPVQQGPSRQPYFIGIDVGLVGDATAVAIGHLDNKGRVIVDLVDQIKAGEGAHAKEERLDFDGVADWIHDLSRRFMFADGIFDQWAGIPFEQALHKKGLRQLKSIHFTKPLESQVYQNFKDMMWDGRLVLYDFPIEQGKTHCGYIEELLELQQERHSKNIIEVYAPKMPGKHDDRSDALVRMVYCAAQHAGKAAYIAQGKPSGRANMLRTAEAELRRAALRARRLGSSPDRQLPPRFGAAGANRASAVFNRSGLLRRGR